MTDEAPIVLWDINGTLLTAGDAGELKPELALQEMLAQGAK